MLDGIGTAAVRVAGSIVLDRDTGGSIERELDNRLAGEQWTFENYVGEDVTLTVESVTVRPKYSPQPEGGGIAQVEANNLFTSLEENRSKPNRIEQLQAIIHQQWISVVRLDIDEDNAKRIRPPGVSLYYLTTMTGLRSSVPNQGTSENISGIPGIRVANTREVQPDRLEMKVFHDGSVGDYRQRISGAIDILKHMQNNMDEFVSWYLMELHHSNKIDSEDEFTWDDPERVSKLCKYLYGFVPDLDTLADELEDINEQLINEDCDSFINNGQDE